MSSKPASTPAANTAVYGVAAILSCCAASDAVRLRVCTWRRTDAAGRWRCLGRSCRIAMRRAGKYQECVPRYCVLLLLTWTKKANAQRPWRTRQLLEEQTAGTVVHYSIAAAALGSGRTSLIARMSASYFKLGYRGSRGHANVCAIPRLSTLRRRGALVKRRQRHK